MTTEVLTLPLPSRVLSPNARPNRFAKSKATAAARTLARRSTYAAMREWDYPAGFVVLSLRYIAHWKSKRVKKDDVNLLASCKAYEDGVQDAIRQDDSTWSLEKPEHHTGCDEPRLVIEINIQEL